ncbi:MAG: hypothetical protein DRP11_01095 [Candidatus Aenigmatarchaeota archaeon]|nr:MAG: hypothetical protein DRP11_01095 [Candidatus Aenigmarchaeota archaeon]
MALFINHFVASTTVDFIFIDNLNSISRYNTPNVALKFSKFMKKRVEEWEIRGILMCNSKESEKMARIVEELSAEKIEVKE